MNALPEAIMYRPPHGYTTGDSRAAKLVAVTNAASTAEQDTGINNDTGEFVTFTTTADCYIRFGVTGIAASTANDIPLNAADGKVSWWCGPDDRYFRVFGGASSGTVKWWKSC